ncbi:MAG: hypothetical protein RO009_02445 [Pseudorhodoplanes sp.]|nr:hypothetical protein [Pseudorhodoplanes sp.]
MTSFRAHPLDPLYEGGEKTQSGADPSAVDLNAFLPALAGMLRETVSRFEDTANRVSDLVIQQREQASLDLIVALQDFDRLQQEFSALGDALMRYIAATDPSTVPAQDGVTDQDVIGGILLEDMRQRLLRRLQSKPAAVELVDEQEF